MSIIGEGAVCLPVLRYSLFVFCTRTYVKTAALVCLFFPWSPLTTYVNYNINIHINIHRAISSIIIESNCIPGNQSPFDCWYSLFPIRRDDPKDLEVRFSLQVYYPVRVQSGQSFYWDIILTAVVAESHPSGCQEKDYLKSNTRGEGL